MTNRKKFKNTFPSSLCSFQAHLYSQFFNCLPQVVQKNGNGSCSQLITLHIYCTFLTLPPLQFGENLFQHEFFTGCSFLQGTSTCSSGWSSTGHKVDLCSTADLHALQGHGFLTMVFTTGYWEISALMLGAGPPPPSLLILMSAELLLACSHSSVPCGAAQIFF